jgi:hypothetical protein
MAGGRVSNIFGIFRGENSRARDDIPFSPLFTCANHAAPTARVVTVVAQLKYGF